MNYTKYAWWLFFACIVAILAIGYAYANEIPPVEKPKEDCHYVESGGDSARPVCHYVDFRICGKPYTMEIHCP